MGEGHGSAHKFSPSGPKISVQIHAQISHSYKNLWLHTQTHVYVCMYKLIEIEFVCFCSHVYLKHAPSGAIKTHRNTYPLLCLCDSMSRSCALRSIYLFYQFYTYTHTHIKIHISVRTRGGANRNQHTHTHSTEVHAMCQYAHSLLSVVCRSGRVCVEFAIWTEQPTWGALLRTFERDAKIALPVKDKSHKTPGLLVI